MWPRAHRSCNQLRPGHGPGLLEGHVPSWGLAVAAGSNQLFSSSMEVGTPFPKLSCPPTQHGSERAQEGSPHTTLGSPPQL